MMQLLTRTLDKVAADQILLIAPAFDMSIFLKEDFSLLEFFPKEIRERVASQYQFMKMITSLLYRSKTRIESIEDILSGIHYQPKMHIICFEYDVFYPQALLLKTKHAHVTLESVLKLFNMLIFNEL